MPRSYVRKGRAAGERNKSAILREADVRVIRRRGDAGEKMLVIHLDYPQVTLQAIYAIHRRKNWKHVPED